MNQYNTVMKILLDFDANQQNPIREDGEIARLIRSTLEDNDETTDPKILAELYAFSLLENMNTVEKTGRLILGQN